MEIVFKIILYFNYFGDIPLPNKIGLIQNMMYIVRTQLCILSLRRLLL